MSHKAGSKCQLGWLLARGHGGESAPKLTHCWQNSLSYGHRPEVCFFAGCQLVAPLSSFRPPAVLVTELFIFEPVMASQVLVTFWMFLTFHSASISSVSSLRKFSCVLGLMWLPCTYKDNLGSSPCFKSHSSNYVCKVFFVIWHDRSQIPGIDNFGRHRAACYCRGAAVQKKVLTWQKRHFRMVTPQSG